MMLKFRLFAAGTVLADRDLFGNVLDLRVSGVMLAKSA